MNLTPHLQEKDMDLLRIEQVQKKKNEFHLIGQEKRVKGHTLFCFNEVTKKIKVAPMNQECMLGLDGSLYLYKNKPHMALCSGVFCLSEERLWDYDDCGGIKMNKDKYRKVTFSNSPRKVEVELKLIEK